MHKNEYKKALTDIRNTFLDYKKILNEESVNILEKSFVKQKEYLNGITLNMISSKNIILNNIGNLIAYEIFKKKTNKDLLDITTHYFKEYENIQKEIKRLTKELEKITTTINFIDNINDNEFEKYLSYKMN